LPEARLEVKEAEGGTVAESIIMPKLAMAMQEGTVVEWLAQEGEWVEKGREVMTIETEKVAYQCEAPASGFLHVVAEAGQTVPVFEAVALLALTTEELARLQSAEPAMEAVAESATAPPAPAEAPPERQAQGGRISISPIAKKLAQQHDLDISTIAGTGPGGRIVKGDVETALAQREAATVPPPPGEEGDGRQVKATIPLAGMRKAIADHMHRSLAAAAQMSTVGEIDMTEMIRLRERLLQKEEELGVRVSFTDLFLLVLARAVQHVPIVNSSLMGDEIRIWEDINIGVAVALERGEYESGLIVPVLKNVDRMPLIEISRTLKDLTARATSNRLTLEDVGGGTITLSNIGVFARGWTASTPIINQPESVIVQPGAIADRPVAVDGQVVVRPVMTMSITFDHRVVDGVPIARFYNKMAELMENPALLHLQD
jgi:pyruvate dehydrogenase E2 component (dihydrolipoamide acetyltransferase)